MNLVLGATGFLGSAVCEMLLNEGVEYYPVSLSTGIDLRNPGEVRALFSEIKPSKVFFCAANCGGIQYGLQKPANIFLDNSRIMLNVFEAAVTHSVERLINPIPNCAYPGHLETHQESKFWDGELHESVRAYGSVRKASQVASEAFAKEYGLETVSLVFPNLYGPGEHLGDRAHALGGLVQRLLAAKLNNESRFTIWGSGNPVRDWLFVTDAARAMIVASDLPHHANIINYGSDEGVSIADLARLAAELIGYSGEFVFDLSKVDGARKKVMVSGMGRKILGITPLVALEEGLRRTIDWYEHQNIPISR